MGLCCDSHSEAEEVQPMDEKSEKGVEHYEFEKELSSGAFGSVSKYKIIKQDRFCAVKKISREFLLETFGNADMVIDEKKFMEDLFGHDNIIKLLATFKHEDHYWFVMEFAENKDLYELVSGDEGRGKLDLKVVRAFAAQMVLALEEL
jgi:serine/threonine protein kinase